MPAPGHKKTNSRPSTPSIEIIPSLKKFRTSYSPIISKLNKESIETKLALEKHTTASTSERVYNNNMYINYQRNPFLNSERKRGRFSISFSTVEQDVGKGKKQSKEILLTDQYTKLQTSPRKIDEKKAQRSQKINEVIAQAENISNRIISSVTKARIKTSKPEEVEPSPPKPQFQVVGMSDYEKTILKNTSIDQILEIQQPNFFLGKHHKKINIFKSISDDDQIKSPYQQLSQHNFSFEAIIQKINKITVPIIRDMAKLGRDISKGKNIGIQKLLDHLENQEVSIKEKDIRFMDLLGFASGRISWQLINHLNSDVMTKNKDDGSEDNSSQDLDIVQPHFPNTKQFSTYFQNPQQQNQQIAQFAYIEMSKNQQQTRQYFSKVQQRIRALLQNKHSNIKQQIFDRKLHQNIDHKVQDNFGQYFRDGEYEVILGDVAQVVKKRKRWSDRGVGFQMGSLVQVVKGKGEMDVVVEKSFSKNKNMSDNKTKSKSQTKTKMKVKVK